MSQLLLSQCHLCHLFLSLSLSLSAPFINHSFSFSSLHMGLPSCPALEGTWSTGMLASGAGTCWTAPLFSAMQKRRSVITTIVI